MTLQSKIVAAILVLSLCAFVWHRWHSDVYGRAHSLYEAGRYAESLALLETAVFMVDGIDTVFVRIDRIAEKPPIFELLGHMYEYGKGTEIDLDHARHLYVGALNDQPYKIFPTDAETQARTYVGYSNSPQAALGACRLSHSFESAFRFCRIFEHPVNVMALDNPDELRFALDKYQSFFDEADSDTRLYRAAISGRFREAQIAIANGANVDYLHKDDDIWDVHNPLGIMFQTSGGTHVTPLWAAAARLDVPMMELLLDSGADPNLRPTGVKTSLIGRSWASLGMNLWWNDDRDFAEVTGRVSSIVWLLHRHQYEIDDSDYESIARRSGRKDSSLFQAHDERLDRAAKIVLQQIEQLATPWPIVWES